MFKTFVLVGLLLLTAGSVLAQDEFPKVETSPAFMYIHTPVSFTIPLTSPIDPGASFSKGFNCAGGGGTLGIT